MNNDRTVGEGRSMPHHTWGIEMDYKASKNYWYITTLYAERLLALKTLFFSYHTLYITVEMGGLLPYNLHISILDIQHKLMYATVQALTCTYVLKHLHVCWPKQTCIKSYNELRGIHPFQITRKNRMSLSAVVRSQFDEIMIIVTHRDILQYNIKNSNTIPIPYDDYV